jgi:uncharacterized membrane protein
MSSRTSSWLVKASTANYENFPRFMSNIEEIRNLGNGQSHWVVKGPAGTTVEWDATLMQVIPNEMIAWRTQPVILNVIQ